MSKILVPDETYECVRCGRCCIEPGESIQTKGMAWLNEDPVEALKIFINVHRTEIALVRRDVEALFSRGFYSWNFFRIRQAMISPSKNMFLVPVIRYKRLPGGNLACTFYDFRNRECLIYEIRPLICRLYPYQITKGFGILLLIAAGEMKPPETIELSLDRNCPGVGKMASKKDKKRVHNLVLKILSSPPLKISAQKVDKAKLLLEILTTKTTIDEVRGIREQAWNSLMELVEPPLKRGVRASFYEKVIKRM